MKYLIVGIAAILCFVQILKLVDDLKNRKKEKEKEKNDCTSTGND